MKKSSKALLFTSLSTVGLVATIIPTVTLTSCSLYTPPTQPIPKQNLDTSAITTPLAAYQFMSKNLNLSAQRIGENLNWNAFVKVRNITQSNLANNTYSNYEQTVHFSIGSFNSDISQFDPFSGLKFKLSADVSNNINYVKPENDGETNFWSKDKYSYRNLDASIVLVESRTEQTTNKCYYPAILISNYRIGNQTTTIPNAPIVIVEKTSQTRTNTSNNPVTENYSYTPPKKPIVEKHDYYNQIEFKIDSGINNINTIDYSILQTGKGLICMLPYEGICFRNIKL